jgi:hypothetical protein
MYFRLWRLCIKAKKLKRTKDIQRKLKAFKVMKVQGKCHEEKINASKEIH